MLKMILKVRPNQKWWLCPHHLAVMGKYILKCMHIKTYKSVKSVESTAINPRSLKLLIGLIRSYTCTKDQTSSTKIYRLPREHTELTLQIQNRGHYSLTKGKRSFSQCLNSKSISCYWSNILAILIIVLLPTNAKAFVQFGSLSYLFIIVYGFGDHSSTTQQWKDTKPVQG